MPLLVTVDLEGTRDKPHEDRACVHRDPHAATHGQPVLRSFHHGKRCVCRPSWRVLQRLETERCIEARLPDLLHPAAEDPDLVDEQLESPARIGTLVLVGSASATRTQVTGRRSQRTVAGLIDASAAREVLAGPAAAAAEGRGDFCPASLPAARYRPRRLALVQPEPLCARAYRVA
jgi:hypothetical protein